MVRTYFLLMSMTALTLVACGKFASEPAVGQLSVAANPLQAEREDIIKLPANKAVPSAVAALFSKERKQSDAAFASSFHSKSPSDPRLMASFASLARFDRIILQRRAELLRLLDLMAKGQKLSKEESAWLVAISAEFKAQSGNLEDLKKRVDVWPASFILGSMLAMKSSFENSAVNSWPTESELSDRLTVLNTSNKPAIIAVRQLRSRLATDSLAAVSLKSDREKLQMLVEELTTNLSSTLKTEMLKTVLDISTALEGNVVGVKP